MPWFNARYSEHLILGVNRRVGHLFQFFMLEEDGETREITPKLKYLKFTIVPQFLTGAPQRFHFLLVVRPPYKTEPDLLPSLNHNRSSRCHFFYISQAFII
jgi:hypothetical protein